MTNGLYLFFSQNMRSELFGGLLTICTFVFAVKTFIVVKMKEDIFDQAFYRERLSRMERLAGKPYNLYRPLKNLATVLFVTEIVALLAAIAQLTVGLFPADWAALVCIGGAGTAMILLFVCIFLVRQNLAAWLKEPKAYARRDTK